MERVALNFNFERLEKALAYLDVDHSSSTLSKIRDELNKLFNKSKCKEILYTTNTDKLFFGMRTYVNMTGNDAVKLFGSVKSNICESYFIEIDSKLFDPMLNLNPRELTAILLHEIGHVAYDTNTIDEVRKNADLYFVKSGNSLSLANISHGYKNILAYALKDSIYKVGSLFSKFGNEEIIADSFVESLGYGPDLASAFNKLRRSIFYINKTVDNKLTTLNWALRMSSEIDLYRYPAIKTLNSARDLTGSRLEQRELSYITNQMNRMDGVYESMIDNEYEREQLREAFGGKFVQNIKTKGIRNVKNDIYELNLRLRTAKDADELFLLIRQANSDIVILQDYIATENPSASDKKECEEALMQLYDIRERAAKHQQVKNYDSLITVVYTD